MSQIQQRFSKNRLCIYDMDEYSHTAADRATVYFSSGILRRGLLARFIELFVIGQFTKDTQLDQC